MEQVASIGNENAVQSFASDLLGIAGAEAMSDEASAKLHALEARMLGAAHGSGDLEWECKNLVC
ncbi:hypothetical protein [Paraburkholderia tropica]|jgi:hypothetical protein|uniref:hypothetical protein n=1 Tax=Paraburkholderia tropica TaxID=92647 RepID=UPI002AB6FE4F|nr:hypothetical protein [Paraburkholderia tropica]